MNSPTGRFLREALGLLLKIGVIVVSHLTETQSLMSTLILATSVAESTAGVEISNKDLEDMFYKQVREMGFEMPERVNLADMQDYVKEIFNWVLMTEKQY